MLSSNVSGNEANITLERGNMDESLKLGLTIATTIAMGIGTIYFTRRSKKRDDICNQIVTDLNSLIGLVQAATTALIIHQQGSLGSHKSLAKSREAVSTQLKEVSLLQKRLHQLIASQVDKTEWERLHVSWKFAGISESGLLTDKEHKWGSGEIVELEGKSEMYVNWLTSLRSRIISGAVKLTK